MVRNERVVTIFQGGIVKFYINLTIKPSMPVVVPIIQIILIVIIRAFLVAITQIESSYYITPGVLSEVARFETASRLNRPKFITLKLSCPKHKLFPTWRQRV